MPTAQPGWASDAPPPPTAWQGVERDLRSQMSGSERGLVEEYVEKVPNPSLKSELGADLGGRSPARGWGGREACLLPASETARQVGWVPGLPEGVQDEGP